MGAHIEKFINRLLDFAKVKEGTKVKANESE